VGASTTGSSGALCAQPLNTDPPTQLCSRASIHRCRVRLLSSHATLTAQQAHLLSALLHCCRARRATLIRLTSIRANHKFSDLSATVRLAKTKYGVEHFFVWHAVQVRIC
jgi:hypothetical protein